MSTAHETKPQPIQVVLQPGYWLAHTTDGRMVACCEELPELEREVQRAGLDPADVQLLQLPDQSDDELMLGGCEWSLDVERLHHMSATATAAPAGEAVSTASSVPSSA